MKWLRAPLRMVAPSKASNVRFSPNDRVWHLTLDQIESSTGYVVNKRIGPASEAGTSTFVFDEGNVLYSKLRPYLNKVVCPREPGIATTELVPLRPKPWVLDRCFLTYYLRSNHFLTFAKAMVAGVKMPRLIMEKFWKHQIPIPPLSEQRRIVEILDQADALRKKRAEADAKAERILPALFYKMFGDPLVLMRDRNSIPLAQFDIELQNGFACGQKDVEDGVPHLRMNNIDDAGVLNLDLIRTVPPEKDDRRYRLQRGDVLFMGTNSEDKIGKTCVFFPPDGRQYLFSNHLIRIRISDSRVSPEFLATYLHLLWGKRFYPSIAKRWVNQATVAQAALAKVRVPVPHKQPLKDFNQAFSELLLSRDKRVQSAERVNDLFDVLLHRAFSGDLTAQWREAHMKELLAEMEEQAKLLEAAT